MVRARRVREPTDRSMGGPQRPAEAQAIGIERFRGSARILELGGARTRDRSVRANPREPGSVPAPELGPVGSVECCRTLKWRSPPHIGSTAMSVAQPEDTGKLPRGPSEQPGRRRWRKSRRKFPGLIVATPVQSHAASTNLAFDAPWGPARLAVRSKYRDSPPNAPCRNRSSHLPRRLRRTQTFP